MTSEHVKYFSDALGLTPERIQRIYDHLLATNQAWCFVDGQIVDRGFCERYIEEVTP